MVIFSIFLIINIVNLLQTKNYFEEEKEHKIYPKNYKVISYFHL